MNTVSVTGSLSRNAGGLFESVRRLHQSLAEIPGVDVTVLGLRDENTSLDAKWWDPVPVETFTIRGPQRFGYAPGLSRRLIDAHPDIVHTHGIWMYISVAVTNLHRRYRTPYLISAHGMLDHWAVGHAFWKKRVAHAVYESEHLRNAACLRALCEPEAKAIRQSGLTNPIAVIPNGVDLPVDEEARVEGPLCELKVAGRNVLLYLGRLHPKKGLVNLVKAWSAAAKLDKKWVLAIAGWDEGGHENELMRMADEMNVFFVSSHQDEGVGLKAIPAAAETMSILFLGPRFNVEKRACYRGCDGFILPSQSEGLPMVVLEAWAYSKPVIITPQCNLTEGIRAAAGIEIPATVEGILAGLKVFFEMSDAERQVMGENGRALVGRDYCWPNLAGSLKRTYDWILGGGEMPAFVSYR